MVLNPKHINCIILLVAGKIIVSRNVMFNEEASWNWSIGDGGKEDQSQISLIEETNSISTPVTSPTSTPIECSPATTPNATSGNSSSTSESSAETPPRKFKVITGNI